MAERTSATPGAFVWADLATSDLDAAKAFYGGLFGWTFEDVPSSAGTYAMASLDGAVAAGAYVSGQGPPHWNSYVAVDSADATAARAADAGGTVAMEPFDVERVGRMAVIADPTGAHLALWEERGNRGAAVVNAPGAISWNELGTTDPDRAATFYAELFGWTTDRAESAAGGVYITVSNAGRLNGGIRAQDPQAEAGVPPNWLVYFGCADLDAALARATELGALVIVPRMDLPMGSFAVLQDPQGAVFALYAGRFDD